MLVNKEQDFIPQQHKPILSEADRVFLKKLQEIDFGPIAFKLMNPEEGQGWNLEQATHAIEQYRRFLFLNHRHSDHQIVPTREVDKVWHTHILDTAKYREDCERMFGGFIDHWPYFGMRDEADRKQLEEAFAQTKVLLEQYFGAAL